jgi:hypothetical protein
MLNNHPLRRSRTKMKYQILLIIDSTAGMDMTATRKFMLLLGIKP